MNKSTDASSFVFTILKIRAADLLAVLKHKKREIRLKNDRILTLSDLLSCLTQRSGEIAGFWFVSLLRTARTCRY
jgi:hypothetical protein